MPVQTWSVHSEDGAGAGAVRVGGLQRALRGSLAGAPRPD